MFFVISSSFSDSILTHFWLTALTALSGSWVSMVTANISVQIYTVHNNSEGIPSCVNTSSPDPS